MQTRRGGAGAWDADLAGNLEGVAELCNPPLQARDSLIAVGPIRVLDRVVQEVVHLLSCGPEGIC